MQIYKHDIKYCHCLIVPLGNYDINYRHSIVSVKTRKNMAQGPFYIEMPTRDSK